MTYKFQMNHWREPLQASATEVLVGSTAGWVGFSTSSGDWSSEWGFYDTGTRTYYEIQYGKAASDDSDIWVAVLNGATSGGRVANDSLPTATSDWDAVDLVDGNSYPQGVSNGVPSDDSKASWCVAARDGRFSYVDDDGDPATAGNWTRLGSGQMPGHLTDVTFNQDTASPVWVRSNNRFQLDSSTDGINWTTRQNAQGGNPECFDIEYANNLWVAIGEQQFTGSANGQTWGTMNSPANRTMNSSAGNGGDIWICVGPDGYVWLSTDNAATWSESRVPDSRGAGNFSNMNDVAYDGSGVWVIVGDESEMWKSADDGSTWTNITPARSSYGNFGCIEFNILLS